MRSEVQFFPGPPESVVGRQSIVVRRFLPTTNDQRLTTEFRGCSSAGRAPGLQPGGHRFDPGQLHQRLRIPRGSSMVLRLARWLKWVLWPLSLLIALAAFWVTVLGKRHPSGIHQLKVVALCGGAWVVTSFGALFLERFTRQSDVGRQMRQP